MNEIKPKIVDGEPVCCPFDDNGEWTCDIEVLEAYAHLGAALAQSIDSDNQIIMQHVRDAHKLLSGVSIGLEEHKGNSDQIDDMKCCGNCSNWDAPREFCHLRQDRFAGNGICKEWEAKK